MYPYDFVLDLAVWAALAPLIGLALVVVGVGGLAWHWRQAWLAVQEERQGVEGQVEILRETLVTSADGYMMWTVGDDFVCSRRLAVLLRLAGGETSTFEDVLSGFTAPHAEALRRAIAGLRDTGVGFVLDLERETSGRWLRTVGVAATGQDGRTVADVVWMRDVTDEARVSGELEQRVASLQAERDRLRAVLDTLPTPVWTRDDSLTIQDCNWAFARALDQPEDDEVPAQRRELATGGAGQEMRALAARSRAAGEACRARFHAILEGERRLLDITETPVTQGPLAGFTVGLAQDITPIEEVESRLEREIEAHAEVLERLGSAIALFGIDTRLRFHNAAFAQLWGLEAAWLAAGPGYGDFLERLRENRRLPEVADFPAFKAGELGFFTKLLRPREDILHLPDGATLRRVVAPHPLGGLIATFEDVTDSLALERSYNQLTAVLRETLDHLHEAVAVFGANGRLRLFNPTFVNLLDLQDSLGEPLAADLVTRLDPSMRPGPQWETFRRRLAARSEGRGPRTGQLVRMDGRHLDYATVPLPDGGLLLSILDVTDRVRVEQALRERTEALRAADRMKSAFIENISYELRSPLGVLSGLAGALADPTHDGVGESARETVGRIVEGIGQLSRLVEEISGLVSIEAGNLSLDLDAFDVPALLSAVLALGREAARRRGVTLSEDCPADIGWMVGDATRVKQILYHLMSTALTSTGPGGAVVLAARRDSANARDWMVFTVADTGGAVEGLGSTVPGEGLGLALVHRFAELHGGSLAIEGDPQNGTTATVRLPVGG
ncbi:PAS domain-containing sensor histidine kinase [Pararhodospirillum photometricum]|nr:PAS domain-containing sensor histidine kinase [Pararhodospirillum photometricum]